MVIGPIDQLRSECDDSEQPLHDHNIVKFDPLLAAISSHSPASLGHHPDIPNTTISTIPDSSLFAGICASKRQRSPNWTSKEDEQLARSWVAVSLDPFFASEQHQRGEEFYRRLGDHFSKNWNGVPRTSAGVRERWGILQPACLRFNTIYHQIYNRLQQAQPDTVPSPDHCRRMAHECFSEQSIAKTQRHRQFQFETVWEIVRDTPKFQALTLAKTGAGSSGSNGVGAAQSSESSPSHLNGHHSIRVPSETKINLAENNGQATVRSSQAGSQAMSNKRKRRAPTARWGSEAAESDTELEVLRKRLSFVDKRAAEESKEANAIARERLALERERFAAENEVRAREAERVEREMNLRVREAEREELSVDIEILKLNLANCDDESREAIRLLKSEVIQKHQQRLG